MIDDSQQTIREYIQNNQIQQLIEYINENKPNILNLDCGKKQTILHIAVQNNDYPLLKFLEEYCNEQYKEQETRKLVNALNIEIFTALHIASYHGNVQAVKILLNLGADPALKSGSGLLPIHAAAQGDKPYTVWFWIQQGISVNALDDAGNTCLHWATYQNSELTVGYLISFGCDLDLQNNQKQTALHLGTLYGHPRIVKKLLIKGASRNFEDADGQLPLHLADTQNIKKMLEDKMDLALFYNLKQPYHPIKRNRKSMLTYYFVIISSQYCIGYMVWMQQGIIIQFEITIFVILLLFSILVQCCDAGVIKKNVTIDQVIELSIDPANICSDCWVIKPKRSRHCEFCRKCIIVYDHHCPWINNCVGAKYQSKIFSNIFYFFMFLLSLIIIQIFSSVVIVLYYFWKSNLSFLDYFLMLYPLATIAIFFIPIVYSYFNISALMIYQSKNLYFGLTTYERITNQKVNIKASLLFAEENIQDSQIAEQQIEPSMGNCYNQCFRNKKAFKKYT